MSPRSTVLVDTGFLYALFDPRDQFNSQAVEKAGVLDRHTSILPWPILYEVLKTRFVKKTQSLLQLEALQKQAHVVLLSDLPYREPALQAVYRSAPRRSLSLVDMVLRLMIEDVNVRTDAVLTFNPGDFANVCAKHRVKLL